MNSANMINDVRNDFNSTGHVLAVVNFVRKKYYGPRSKYHILHVRNDIYNMDS